jgi:hypothetical protein
MEDTGIMSKLPIPYAIIKLTNYYQYIGPDRIWYYTWSGRLTSTTSLDIYNYSVIEYYFPVDPLSTYNFPYKAGAKLRIFANNTNYASALLRIYTGNSIKAKLKIQTENKIQAKLRIQTTGPAQAKLYIMTLRASPRPQARLRIIADNSNYASALLRIETKRLEPAQAKLRIRTRTYNRRISMPDYYAFYNINTFGFLP